MLALRSAGLAAQKTTNLHDLPIGPWSASRLFHDILAYGLEVVCSRRTASVSRIGRRSRRVRLLVPDDDKLRCARAAWSTLRVWSQTRALS